MHRHILFGLALACGVAIGGCAPGPAPSPDANRATPEPIEIPVARGAYDGGTVALQPSPGECFEGADVTVVGADPRDVDRAIDAAGEEEGWVEVPLPGYGHAVRYFHGRAEAAAVAFGGVRVAIGGRGDVWIVDAEGVAHELVPLETPKGRTFWMTTGTQRRVPCPPGS